MKRITATCFLLILIVLSTTLTGCFSNKRIKEEGLYRESLDAFFGALEDRDADSIKSLFSKTAVQSDADLDEQIAKLIDIYPDGESAIMFDGLLGADYLDESGKHKSAAYTTTPIICDNRYFWVFLELVYEDDFSEENVGISQVLFFTADEYCAFWNSDDKFPENLGLSVFSDLNLENEVVPIESYPYEFTPIERTLTEADVEEFLTSSNSLSEFREKFGEPNATGFESYFYKLTADDGTVKYVDFLALRGETITSANIVGEFEFIREII